VPGLRYLFPIDYGYWQHIANIPDFKQAFRSASTFHALTANQKCSVPTLE